MKLYRIDPDAQDGGYASHFTIRAAIEWELLVEVEKCMHGKYDAHGPGVSTRIVCLGAGLEDTE